MVALVRCPEVGYFPKRTNFPARHHFGRSRRRKPSVVAEVRPGGSGEERDIRPGDVLRACSAISSTIVYGNAMFPLDGANTKWRRTFAPCDMQPFETVMEQITSNEGTMLVEGTLVLEREPKINQTYLRKRRPALRKGRLGPIPRLAKKSSSVLGGRHGATQRRQRPRRRRDAF